MKQYYRLELCHTTNSNLIYFSDLYPTREKALAAFLNKETGEAFTCLADVQKRTSLFTFSPDAIEGTPPYLIDDYWQAYSTGNPEVCESIDSLFAWITGRQKEWQPSVQLTWSIQAYTAHD